MKVIKRMLQFFRLHDFEFLDSTYLGCGIPMNNVKCKKCGYETRWPGGSYMMSGLVGFLFYHDCKGKKAVY